MLIKRVSPINCFTIESLVQQLFDSSQTSVRKLKLPQSYHFTIHLRDYKWYFVQIIHRAIRHRTTFTQALAHIASENNVYNSADSAHADYKWMTNTLG